MSSVNVETEQPIASPATLPAAGAAGADGLLTTIIEEIQLTGRPVTHKLILAVLLERLETEHDPQMQDRYREALNSFMHTSVMDDICPLALACAVAGRAAQCLCCGTGQAPQGFDAALAGADAERRRLVTLLLRGPARIILAALFCGACFIRLRGVPMAIDFHAGSNQYSYARRVAHAGWGNFIQQRVDAAGKAIADIGCGGGIYSAAWAGLGARQVTGVDFSAQMLQDAQETVQGLTNVAFVQGDAAATGLADASQDIVFARALIHHFDSPQPFLHEAWCILAPGGLLLIQDRTPEDVFLPGSPEHMRGWFFDLFPPLAAIERARRPPRSAIEAAITTAGFELRPTTTLRETRREYADSAALAADLRGRTGRSILHELSAGADDCLYSRALAGGTADRRKRSLDVLVGAKTGRCWQWFIDELMRRCWSGKATLRVGLALRVLKKSRWHLERPVPAPRQ